MRNTWRNRRKTGASRPGKAKWIALGGLGLAGYALVRSQRKKMRIPRSMILDLPADPAAPVSRQGSIQFIGTATCLVRYGGFTILTDPNFLHRGEAVHLGYGVQSTRLTEPAIDFEKLPAVDFVILSHMHEDHFDKLVQRRLNKSMPILTTPQAARSLERKGFRRLYPLETWDRIDVRKGAAEVRLTSMPGTHGPMVVSSFLPSVMGSMLEFRNPATPVSFRIYITGDTLIHGDLREIPRRYPNVDIALLHLGGTRIMGVLVTMDADQGVEAIRIVDPRVAIPIHYNDYTVFKSSLEEFTRAVAAANLQDRVRYLHHGETYQFEVAPKPAVNEPVLRT